MAEVRPAFTEFIVCLIREFAVGEDRQRPLFFQLSELSYLSFLSTNEGGEIVDNEVTFFLLAGFFQQCMSLLKGLVNQNEAILEDNSVG